MPHRHLPLAAFALLSACARPSAPAAAEKSAARPAAAPLRVSVVNATPAPLVETITATGTLRADEGVELQAEVNGRIVLLRIAEGSPVRRGDLLVKLNDADLRASLQRAAWKKELADAKERRLESLLQRGASLTQEEYDNALNEVNVQRAEIALIEAQIAKTEIRAPFDGVVGLRYVSEGAFVNATTRIATLQSVERIKIDFSVPERHAARLTGRRR
ncbi:MAG: efflux RND transporter periplasmic adaptor subunit [Opitutaceae bacterium]|nr:efflux RND transporter periplasmic adaptor subunit [Opitutaceae bacterium]